MPAFERVPHDRIRRGQPVTIIVDGTPAPAFLGESVATTMLAADRMRLRDTPKHGAPRGVFCAMGVCFDCLVSIDGISGIRACMTPVRDGMRVDTRPQPARKDPDGSR